MCFENTFLKICNLCEGLIKDQIKLKYLQDLFSMRRLMLVRQLAKWGGGPESPLAFTIYPLSKQQFSRSSICAHSSVSTFYYTSSIVPLAIHTCALYFDSVFPV